MLPRTHDEYHQVAPRSAAWTVALDDYYAGVYWPGRKESAEEFARRAETFFRLLSRCDPIYARWFEQAGSPKKALQLQFEPTYETFSAWTGHEENGRGGMVMLSCGSGVVPPPNSCLLYLPKVEPEAGRVLTASVLTEVMRALVLAWEPDDGGIISRGYQELRSQAVGVPHIGWLMYFARHRGEVPSLPAPVRVEPVEDKGTLVILTPERFNVDDAVHVALADEVRGLLDKAGLLKETCPPSSTSAT